MNDNREEALHQECNRSNDLRNKLIAMEIERNNLLAALIDEGLDTLSRVLGKAKMNKDLEVGDWLLKVTHGGSAYQRPA